MVGLTLRLTLAPDSPHPGLHEFQGSLLYPLTCLLGHTGFYCQLGVQRHHRLSVVVVRSAGFIQTVNGIGRTPPFCVGLRWLIKESFSAAPPSR